MNLPEEVRRAWSDRCGLAWDEKDDRVREPDKYGWPKDFEIFYSGWKSAYVSATSAPSTVECICPESTGGLTGSAGPVCRGSSTPGCRKRALREALMKSPSSIESTSGETPSTDDLIAEMNAELYPNAKPGSVPMLPCEKKLAEHARQLERKLAEANRWKEIMQGEINMVCDQRDKAWGELKRASSSTAAASVSLPKDPPMELLDTLGAAMFTPYNRLNNRMWERVNEVYKALYQLLEHDAAMRGAFLSATPAASSTRVAELERELAEEKAYSKRLFDRLAPSVEYVEGTPVGYGEDEIDRLERQLRVAQSANAMPSALAVLDKVIASLKDASERRYQVLKEHEATAHKWKAEGDMYGWNFYAGCASGCNEAGIIYFRALRQAEDLRKEIAPSSTGDAVTKEKP